MKVNELMERKQGRKNTRVQNIYLT